MTLLTGKKYKELITGKNKELISLMSITAYLITVD